MVRKKRTQKTVAQPIGDTGIRVETVEKKTMKERLAMFSRTFIRPAKKGGTEEYELGVMFATPEIEDRCEELYEEHGLLLIHALKGSIGGAVTNNIMARVEEQFAKVK